MSRVTTVRVKRKMKIQTWNATFQKMNDFRDELFKKAKSKIVDAQMKQKRVYDRKHGKRKVQTKSS